MSKDIKKWICSWVLAASPLAYGMIDNHIIDDKINFTELCSTGELLFVSIIMVAEPLVGLGLNKSPDRRGNIVTLNFLSIGVLLFSTYVYSLAHRLNHNFLTNPSMQQTTIESTKLRISILSYWGIGIAFIVGLSTVLYDHYSKINMYNRA